MTDIPATTETAGPARRYLVVIHIDKLAVENLQDTLDDHIRALSDFVRRFGGEQYNDALARHYAEDKVVLYHIFNDEEHVRHFCEFAEAYLSRELGIPAPEIATFYETERRVGVW